jgi:hypothetical protein
MVTDPLLAAAGRAIKPLGRGKALSHRRVEASRTAARKFLASLSKRVAIRLKCLSLKK